MDFFERVKSTKIFVRNYKSFGNELHGFSGIEPINLIVGRNNSGKSALLDLVQFACGNYRFAPSTQNRAGKLDIVLEAPVSAFEVEAIFRKGMRGGNVPGGENHFEFGKQYIGKTAILNINPETGARVATGSSFGDVPPSLREMTYNLASIVQGPLEGKVFKRLSAERDVAPEGNGDQVAIAENGRGFTNVVQRFINQSSLPKDLVENEKN